MTDILELKKIALFKPLSDKELSAIAACLREKTFTKGAALFLEEGRCERVFFVRSGRVKLYRMGSDGREQSLQSLGPGESCACNPGTTDWTCSSSAKAVTDCRVWFLSGEDYARLVKESPALAHSLNRIFAERIQCLSNLVEDVSLKDSQKRVAKFLADNGPQITLSREEIASRLGMARETLARQIHALKRRKLIEVEPKKIRVLDKPALEGIAN